MKIKKRLLVSLSLVLLVCVLIAMPVSAKAKKKKKGLKLNKTTVSMILGYDTQLKVKGKKKAKWKTSNPAVATVDKKGWVTAVGEGTATITAKASGKTGTCEVTVTSGLNILLPQLPMTVSNALSEFRIESATVNKVYDWDLEKYKVTITLTVVRTKAKTTAWNTAQIGWKIYDTANIVTNTGIFSTKTGITEGTRFLTDHTFVLDDGTFRFDFST